MYKLPITFIVLALALTACQKDPQQSAYTGAGFRVEKLFTHEGCTVYRFYDDRTVYYTNCRGSTQATRSCGKNCTTTDEVSTDETVEQ